MIYVECNPDEVLVKALGIPRREIHHSGNKPEVCKRLKKSENCTGLVDEDPSSEKLTYIDKLKLHSNDYNIKLLIDEKGKNYLIVLCPKLEEWILKAAEEAKIYTPSYGLPDDPDELHKFINTRLKNFENLIKDIIKQKSRMIKTLEGFLKKKI